MTLPLTPSPVEVMPPVKLKPCPFCGTDDLLFPSYRGVNSLAPYAIDCVRCGFDFEPREGMDVVAAWNRRAEGRAARKDGG